MVPSGSAAKTSGETTEEENLEMNKDAENHDQPVYQDQKKVLTSICFHINAPTKYTLITHCLLLMFIILIINATHINVTHAYLFIL